MDSCPIGLSSFYTCFFPTQSLDSEFVHTEKSCRFCQAVPSFDSPTPHSQDKVLSLNCSFCFLHTLCFSVPMHLVLSLLAHTTLSQWLARSPKCSLANSSWIAMCFLESGGFLLGLFPCTSLSFSVFLMAHGIMHTDIRQGKSDLQILCVHDEDLQLPQIYILNPRVWRRQLICEMGSCCFFCL